MLNDLTPKQIVKELDRFIIGQEEAKKSVAIALRNRWRHQQLTGDIKDEIYPKNLLMIGPTGVGKTEISRRLSKLAKAPFIKVEATKFTEVGYVGRDVEQIVRDLLEDAIILVKKEMSKSIYEKAKIEAENIVLKYIAGDDAREATKDTFRKKLRNGLLDETEIEIEVFEKSNPLPLIDIPGSSGGSMGVMNISDILGKNFGLMKKRKKVKIKESHKILIEQEMEKLLDNEIIQKEAKIRVEQSGIVFIDEIDKVCTNSTSKSAEVSREGVQRDLLPLIEGTTVSTKHGSIKTDQILFICSGAFHLSKPSDLLPELQGRLPIRVQLNPLKKEQFKKILIDTDNSLTKQYIALIKTEGVELVFSDDGIEKICLLAEEVNFNVENIGARRLHTILEKVLENVSFNAPDLKGTKVIVDAKLVEKHVGNLSKTTDLRKYVL
ncbi:ATP-dependent protease ATPase subunit HslU [Paracoccaceae bacterium]|nr:ATP-dependent protease ATPase subunit HslU [Paracoccaceae bacterium]